MDYVNIGSVKLEKTAVLAPMAGVCDRAQRVLCREFGASAVFGEMASSAALVYGDKKTPPLMASRDDERPFAAQLFGNRPDFMAQAAVIAASHNPDIIDINSGCPMPKITGNGAGSALLKDLKLLGEIVEAVVKAVKIPVTVKIRSGWDKNSVNAVEAAKICEASGASAITVHARTREQLYSGFADWEIIADVKKAVKIPVIGNGDVGNWGGHSAAEKCKMMYEQTGCDLVMIGRAAWGAPWIFKLSDEAVPLQKRLEIMERHIDLLIEDKGENTAMKQARAHIARYLRGIRNAAAYRNMTSTLTTKKDFLRLAEIIKTDYKI